MLKCVHLTIADIHRVPWKNGRGTTEELRLWPPGADFARGDFDWRLARAAVVESGPFSAFPGFDRVLVVVQGSGLALEHGDEAPAVELAPLQSHRFAGEWPTRARLLGGPVADLNLLLRRDVVRGELGVACLDARPERIPLVAGEELLVHVLTGTLQVRLAPPPGGPVSPGCAQAGGWRLATGESLHLREPAGGETLELRPEDAAGPARCVAAVVRIAPVAPHAAARC